MVTRNVIARLSDRIDAAVSRLAPPPPPEPRHPGLAALRQMMTAYVGAEKAEAGLAEAAREGHGHLREHPEHPLYGRSVSEEEARAVYEAASATFERQLQRWLDKRRRIDASVPRRTPGEQAT
jgi:hypothetical protein